MFKNGFFASLIFSLAVVLAMGMPHSLYAQDDDLDLDDEIEFTGDDEGGEDDDFAELDDEDFEDFEDEGDGGDDEITDEDIEGDEDEEISFEEFEEDEVDELAEEDDENLDLEPLDEEESTEELPVVDEEPIEDSIEEPVTIEEPVAEPDEPDLEYEARLYDIFVNYHSQKTPEAEWQSLVGGRASENYNIQKGDSLWGISETIFGDGNYWPKVWSLNGRISNPHLITEGNNIGFLLGTEDEAPAFTVTEEPVVPEPEPDPQLTDSDENKAEFLDEGDEDALEIPPPLKVSKPVLTSLPPSLPFFVLNNQRGDFDDAGISYGRRKIADLKDELPVGYYITEEPLFGLGQVSEIEEGSRIAGAFQYIYVNVKSGEAEVGDTYLAVANKGEVIKPHDSISGNMGYSVEVQGVVQLVERVEGSNESQFGALFRAIVKKILSPVSVGAILIDEEIEIKNVSDEGPRSQVVSQIIGGQYDNRRQVYGLGAIVYLNRGENDGLEEGVVLPIRSNRVVRNDQSIVESNIRPIGWLRIIKTTANFSTALVIRAWAGIFSGDMTGSGAMSQIGKSARYDSFGDDDIEEGLGKDGVSDDLDDEGFDDEFGDSDGDEGGGDFSDDDFGDDFGDEDFEDEDEFFE